MPIVSNIRFDEEDRALVRPSNEAPLRASGSAGSITIEDRPLLSSAAASASPTRPPPRMITSARSMARSLLAASALGKPCPGVRRQAQWKPLIAGGIDVMATAAERARKKDLGPDWRDTLAASIHRFVRRSVGALLIGLSVALGVALITHSSTDPSLSTAAGGPPTNWLGAFGAYASDAMLFLFGPASALFLPLVALVGLRMVRGVDTGPMRRGLLVAGIGVCLIGMAFGL